MTNVLSLSMTPALALALSNKEAAYMALSRASQAYFDTDTESVPVPASMWDAPVEALVPLHPVFGLYIMRRDRMERARTLWLAACETFKAVKAVEPPFFPFEC